MLYLALSAQGNVTLDPAFAVSNVTQAVQRAHDCSRRGLVAAFSVVGLQVRRCARWPPLRPSCPAAATAAACTRTAGVLPLRCLPALGSTRERTLPRRRSG